MSPLLCHGWASISVPNDCTREQSFNAALASILLGSSWRWTWTALKSSLADSFHDQPSQLAVWIIPECHIKRETERGHPSARLPCWVFTTENNGALNPPSKSSPAPWVVCKIKNKEGKDWQETPKNYGTSRFIFTSCGEITTVIACWLLFHFCLILIFSFATLKNQFVSC